MEPGDLFKESLLQPLGDGCCRCLFPDMQLPVVSLQAGGGAVVAGHRWTAAAFKAGGKLSYANLILSRNMAAAVSMSWATMAQR